MDSPYVLSNRWAITVMWIGVASYFTAVLTYISKFLLRQITVTLDNVVIYSILILGFSILFVATFKKALKVHKDRKDMETPDFFLSRTVRMGWACLVIHFLSIYAFSHKTYLYYPFAILGYALLSISQYIGVFLLVIFYLFSITRTILSTMNAFYGIQKILSMLYMGAYAYIFAVRYIREQKKLKDENKKTKTT